MTTVEERKNEEGMMDIGEHCIICRQLDFLPFECHKCGKSFCNNHRIEFNNHECIFNEQNEKLKKLNNEKIDISKLPKSKDLFPDLNKIRKEAEKNFKIEQNKKIGQRLTNIKDSNEKNLTSIEVAMIRLKKLLGNSKFNNNNNSNNSNKLKKSLFSGFGTNLKSNTSTTSTTALKMIEMNKLKRSAKGDNRININDRIYVWIFYTTDDDLSFNTKTAQFFSKKWPIGKMLDSSAEISKIKNLNNKDVDNSLKLAMFRKIRNNENLKKNNNDDDDNDDEFIYIPTNGRVEREIKDGDEIYILRGQR
ncbi:hypothetical protein C6P40_003346 [Pichia californica]|uniref:AN1-type domain-containing protein n=1 Tax=Pichia californica TaxID=460514 RepID=A0A9P6WH16_9ASCO|nr:hypothetical protein C6P42_002586 [[Candida] californica]KAG0686802.1 hypothetical protein C6P40_003346 [[Candida] californica]